jgi:hypothetical protein
MGGKTTPIRRLMSKHKTSEPMTAAVALAVIAMILAVSAGTAVPMQDNDSAAINNGSVSAIMNANGSEPPIEEKLAAYDPGEGTIWLSYTIGQAHDNVTLDLESLGLRPDCILKSAFLTIEGSSASLPVSGNYSLPRINGTACLDVEIATPAPPADVMAYGLDPSVLVSSYSSYIDIGNGSMLVRLDNKVAGSYYHFTLPVPAGVKVYSITRGDGVSINDFHIVDDVLYFFDDPSSDYLVSFGQDIDSVSAPGDDGWGPLNVTAQPWPDNASWLPILSPSWQPIRAPTYDVTPYDVDISSGGNSTVRIGVNNSIFFCYNNTSKTIFFRMLLSSTPLVPSSRGPYDTYMWGPEIDATGDGYADWAVFLDGNSNPVNYLKSGYNDANSHDNHIQHFIYFQDANTSFTRVVKDGNNTAGATMYYLDFQAPLSALSFSNPQAVNITENTPIRMFFGTSGANNVLDKDLLGYQNNPNFTAIGNVTLLDGARGFYGLMNDTRDPNPPSDLGNWTNGEAVSVTGSAWPINNHSVQNLSVRVMDPNGTIVNTSVINYNTSTGVVSNTTIWTIPASGVNPPGVYSIQVLDPISLTYKTYDNFTLQSRLYPVVSNVTVIPNPALPLSTIKITASVTGTYPIILVNAKLNGNTLFMAYNATSGLYEVITSAPSVAGKYPVNVTAVDSFSGSGQNSTVLMVSAPIQVTKLVTWDSVQQQYAISLIASNAGQVTNVSIFDIVPAGFNATVGGVIYNGPATLTFSNVTGTGSSWQVNYTVQGTSNVYFSTSLYAAGIDPSGSGEGGP